MSDEREYLDTHPWIEFDAEAVRRLGPDSWMRLGEAFARCTELMATPLIPTQNRRRAVFGHTQSLLARIGAPRHATASFCWNDWSIGSTANTSAQTRHDPAALATDSL